MKKRNLKKLVNILFILGWIIVGINIIISTCFKDLLLSNIDLLADYLVKRGFTNAIALLFIGLKFITKNYFEND